jgi:fucose permease
MGVGSSSIFPTMFSFIEELMPVTSRIGSLFLVVSCLGEFTIPFIVGYYVEDHPLVLIYVTTVASIVCFVLFAILCFISRLSAKVLR